VFIIRKVGFRINKGTGQGEVRTNEIAIFCGGTKTANSGNEVIRWSRVNDFLEELSCPQVGTGDFISEYIMYLLIGKVKIKGSIKHELLDVATKELKAIDYELIKDTIKHTYIKDIASVGIIKLQDVKKGFNE
jgi:hypothetical protein